MSTEGHALTKSRTMAARSSSTMISNVRGKVELIFSMRFSCEKNASRRSKAGSSPCKGRAGGAPSPKMAPALVRCSSRLICRSNKRVGMNAPGLHGGDARANAAHIVQDLVEFQEPIVALEHDSLGSMTGQHMIEQIERGVRHRMRVGIGEEGTREKILLNSDAPRHVHFLDDAGGELVQKCMRIKSMIVRIQIEVFDVEQEAGAGLAADEIEKLGVSQIGL